LHRNLVPRASVAPARQHLPVLKLFGADCSRQVPTAFTNASLVLSGLLLDHRPLVQKLARAWAPQTISPDIAPKIRRPWGLNFLFADDPGTIRFATAIWASSDAIDGFVITSNCSRSWGKNHDTHRPFD